MRGYLAFLMTTASALALAGCGPTYPADRQSWSLLETPNAVPDASVEGSLSLFEASDVAEGARLHEGFQNNATNQSLTIFWEGSWSGDKEGVELKLSCVSSSSQNVDAPDCETATLELSCQVVDTKLVCGDYVFQ